MLFMVVEHFDIASAPEVYRRFGAKGRMAPDGLRDVDSWVAADYSTCFQLMECNDVALLQTSMLNWIDVVRFEIVPVTPSAVAAGIARARLPATRRNKSKSKEAKKRP